VCRTHWKEYTSALRRASSPSKAAPAAVAEVERAQADKAEGKPPKSAKAKPGAKPATKPAPGKAGHRAAVDASPAAHDAMVQAEATASTPDVEAGEQEAILVERRQRVKAWRKGELEGTAVKA
jgi:hypothetical protein